jgi:molybdenum cofactor synthesis domain-containing protein
MSRKIEVTSVNISAEKGTAKQPVEEIQLDEAGIAGDAHSGHWHRQVSLLPAERIDEFSLRAGESFSVGDFAENITLRGIDLRDVAVLDRFRIGQVVLETTQIGKKCHGEGCAIYREVGKCIMPKEGIFSRVVHGGRVRPGDEVEYLPKTLGFKVITLSDRAHRGDYPDRSGPRIVKLLQDFLGSRRWHPEISTVVIPDDSEKLLSELVAAREAGVDVVFTTGGTGVGPRDITPETVTEFCDKIIPGIMEAVRIKFGLEKPNALLSRSVAGVAGKTLVFALPGSVKAVEEYLGEILKTLEHLIHMLHELDAH